MKKLLLLSVMALCTVFAQAQDDWTSKMVNPSFEDDWTGWEYDGMSRQGNDAFKLKEGQTYVEKWTGRGGQVGSAWVSQTITGLPAGRYTVTCAAQNIQEDTPKDVQKGVYLQVGDAKTDVNVAGDYSATYYVADGTLAVTFRLLNATGNYVCVDNFRLTKEENDAATYTYVHSVMKQVLAEAAKYNKHLSIPEQTELDEAAAAVEALMSQDVTEGAMEAIVRLQQATYDYRLATASADETLDQTSLIVNPDFEKDGTAGWVNKGMNAQGNDAFTAKHGNTYMERWTGRGGQVGDATLSQLVAMPNGRYILMAAAQNIQEATPSKQQEGTWLFADEAKAPVTTSNKDYKLEFTAIEGQANIGFMARGATGNYICVDNFRLIYCGRSEQMLLGALAERNNAAKELAKGHMNATVLAELNAAIAAAEAQTVSKGMEPVAITLREKMEKAESSIAAYAALATALDEANTLYGEGTGKEAAKFRTSIDAAQVIYNSTDKVEEELAAAVKALKDALLVYRIDNATGTVPTVTTSEFIARGATGALGRSTVKGSNILEQGFCWATHPNPTVLDNRTTDGYNINGMMYLMQPLEPATVYYVRAYAMTKSYAVGYGEVRKIITVPMGTCGWWYNYGAAPDANARIAAALEDCIYYYNNWSGIQGFWISCSYGSGTPTADCSYGGSMRVGPNPSYQRTGTILHESNHGVGIGTSGRWWDGNLHDGAWKGRRANTVLQFIDNNPTATMAGDNMHMWPYGINGAHEDNGWAMTYIANVLITYAMHEDGLVPPGKGGNTPAYTFQCDDDVKYYIMSEKQNGAYLYDAGTTLKWAEADGETLADDDAYAWYVDFTPSRLYYRIRNAKTGKYMSYSGSTIKPVQKNKPTDTEFFQLMANRNDLKYNKGKFVTTSYWIMAGRDESNPTTLTLGNKGATSGTTFDLGDGATQQRWLFLTANEVEKMATAKTANEKEKLSNMVAGAKAMLAVPHTDITETATTELTELVGESEALLAVETPAEVLSAQYDAMWNGIGSYITNTAVDSEEQLYNLDFMVTNPTFTGSEGWTCSDEPTQNFGISEYYQKSFTVTQTLPTMYPGRYELHLQGYERPGSYNDAYNDWSKGTNKVKAFIYYKGTAYKQLLHHIMEDAQDKKVGSGIEQQLGGKYIPDNMEAAAAYFNKGLYDNALVFEHKTRGNMLIGVKNTQSTVSDWTAFDNFHLYSHGNPTVLVDIESIEADQPSPSAIYDLTGRRLPAVPAKGLYIIDGRKVIRK